MLNSILISAALLLGGSSVSTVNTIVEPQVMTAPFSSDFQLMSDATLTFLIEQRAAPHWNMSVSEAWYKYNVTKTLKIVEISADSHYLIKYNDGILDTIIDPSGM